MLVIIAFFIASFVQSSVGFGLALVSMPILVALLGIKVAAPLVAVVAFLVEIIILIRYRHAFNLKAVSRLTIAAVIATPLGVYALKNLDEGLVTTLLGAILIIYALYALLSPRLPELAHQAWAYGFGFFGGLLGGAYNTSGPPAIVYGNCRGWSPDEFKGNLQGYFLVLGVVILGSHALSGNFTSEVWQNFLLAAPGIITGMLAGLFLSKFINPTLFRKIVQVFLIILGIRLIIG